MLQMEDFEAARKKDLVEFNHNRLTMDFSDLMSYVSTDIDWESMADRRRYSLYEQSWQEQRDYIEKGIALLPEALQKEARAYLASEKEIPDIKTTTTIMPGKQYDFGNVSFVIGTTGGMSRLIIDGYSLIEEGKTFWGLSYEQFDFHDYTNFFVDYSRLTRWTTSWAMGDFGRRGIEIYSDVRHEIHQPSIIKAGMTLDDQTAQISLDLAYSDEDVKKWGVPKTNTLVYH